MVVGMVRRVLFARRDRAWRALVFRGTLLMRG